MGLEGLFKGYAKLGKDVYESNKPAIDSAVKELVAPPVKKKGEKIEGVRVPKVVPPPVIAPVPVKKQGMKVEPRVSQIKPIEKPTEKPTKIVEKPVIQPKVEIEKPSMEIKKQGTKVEPRVSQVTQDDMIKRKQDSILNEIKTSQNYEDIRKKIEKTVADERMTKEQVTKFMKPFIGQPGLIDAILPPPKTVIKRNIFQTYEEALNFMDSVKKGSFDLPHGISLADALDMQPPKYKALRLMAETILNDPNKTDEIKNYWKDVYAKSLENIEVGKEMEESKYNYFLKKGRHDTFGVLDNNIFIKHGTFEEKKKVFELYKRTHPEAYEKLLIQYESTTNLRKDTTISAPKEKDFIMRTPTEQETKKLERTLVFEQEQQQEQQEQQAEYEAKAKRKFMDDIMSNHLKRLSYFYVNGIKPLTFKEEKAFLYGDTSVVENKISTQYDKDKSVANFLTKLESYYDTLDYFINPEKFKQEDIDRAKSASRNVRNFLNNVLGNSVNFSKLANLGTDIYYEDGNKMYNGFPIGSEMKTEEGKRIAGGYDIATTLVGSFIPYSGVSIILKGAVGLLAKGKGAIAITARYTLKSVKMYPKIWATTGKNIAEESMTEAMVNSVKYRTSMATLEKGVTAKVASTIQKFAKKHPLTAEIGIYGVGEEVIDATFRTSTGQEYTFNNFLQGIAMNAAFGTVLTGLGEVFRGFKKGKNKEIADKIEAILSTTGDMNAVKNLEVSPGYTLESMFKEKRLLFLNRPQNGIRNTIDNISNKQKTLVPGVDTPAPLPKTDLQIEAEGELKIKEDELENIYIELDDINRKLGAEPDPIRTRELEASMREIDSYKEELVADIEMRKAYTPEEIKQMEQNILDEVGREVFDERMDMFKTNAEMKAAKDITDGLIKVLNNSTVKMMLSGGKKLGGVKVERRFRDTFQKIFMEGDIDSFIKTLNNLADKFKNTKYAPEFNDLILKAGQGEFDDPKFFEDIVIPMLEKYAAEGTPRNISTRMRNLKELGLPMHAEMPEWKATLWERFKRKAQDSMVLVDKMQTTMAKAYKDVIPSSADIVAKIRLFSGKTGDYLTIFSDKKIVPIQKKLIDFRYKNPKDVNLVQKILEVEHAPEYNAIHGKEASGFTDTQAKSFEKMLKTKEGYIEAKKIAEEIKTLNRELLDFLHDKELITTKSYTELKSIYPNYVPFNRIMELEGEDIGKALFGTGIGKGFDVSGKTLKRGKGGEQMIDDIFESTVINWQRAVARAEKNNVGKAALEFTQRYDKNPFFEKVPPVMKKIVVNDEIKWKAEPPKGDFDGADILTVHVKGKAVYLKVEPSIARALKNLEANKVGKILGFLRGITRFLSAINTSFNPEFLISNMFRDIQASALNTVDDLGLVGVSRAVADIPKANYEMFNYVVRGKKDSEFGKLYAEMKAEGGATGFFDVMDRTRAEKTLKGMENEFSRSAVGMPLKTGKKILRGVTMLNEVVENATRVVAYKAALNKGMTKEMAALFAKESTVNFNKQGEWGPVISSLWSFANASIQGTFRTFRALKDPKIAAKKIITLATLSTAVNSWNDYIDPEEYAKINDFVKTSNWVIMLGGGSYIKIPAPYGWNIFKVASDMAYDTAKGKRKVGDAAIKTAGAFLNAYNPIGGETIADAIMPTAGRPFLATLTNTAWHGGQISPSKFSEIKDSLNYYKSTNPIFIKMAGRLGELSGGKGSKPGLLEFSPDSIQYIWEAYSGGVGRLGTNSIKTISDIVNGKKVDPNTVPFVRRLYGKVDDERSALGLLYEMRDKASQEPLDEKDIKAIKEAKKVLSSIADTVDYEDILDNISQNRKAVLKQYNYYNALKDKGYTEKQYIERVNKLNEDGLINKTQQRTLLSMYGEESPMSREEVKRGLDAVENTKNKDIKAMKKDNPAFYSFAEKNEKADLSTLGLYLEENGIKVNDSGSASVDQWQKYQKALFLSKTDNTRNVNKILKEANKKEAVWDDDKVKIEITKKLKTGEINELEANYIYSQTLKAENLEALGLLS